MLKNEFLKMMSQDLETHSNKKQLLQVLDCFKEILKSYPDSMDIDHTKTVEDCFNKMKSFARLNQNNGCYYFEPEESKNFISDYLELKADVKTIVNLEDFI